MGIFDWLNKINPFAADFESTRRFDGEIQNQLDNNTVGYSDQYDSPLSAAFSTTNQNPVDTQNFNAFSYTPTNVDFTNLYENKKQKILKYREMSFYPEIQNALDIICDEAIVTDSEGKCARLNISKEMPDDIERIFHKEFEYVMDTVFRAKDNRVYDLFRKFLVEGELFVEYVKDNNNKNGLVGYQALPVFSTFPVYRANGTIKGFLHNKGTGHDIQNGTRSEKTIPFSEKQVGYVNWGIYGNSVLDVKGYLESAIRPYNQLRHLEDSLVIYRLVRAPERRVWNIEVGRTPPAKAAEFIKSIIHQYQRRLSYDENTGRVDSSKAVQSMSEDYWFSKREGNGSDVTTLQSGMNLGELEDVKYFLAKLFKTLKMPITRWDPNLIGSSYQSGKQIEREELKFTMLVDRMKSRFKRIIQEAFVTHIRLKYGDYPNFQKWMKNANCFDVLLTPSNHFKEFKDLELMTDRLNLLKDLMDLTIDPADPATKTRPFSRKFVLSNPKMFGISQEDWFENEALRKEEILDMEGKKPPEPGLETGFGTEPGMGSELGGMTEPTTEPIAEPPTEAPPEEAPITASYKPKKAPMINETWFKYLNKDKPF